VLAISTDLLMAALQKINRLAGLRSRRGFLQGARLRAVPTRPAARAA
jgi:hypothetical protein